MVSRFQVHSSASADLREASAAPPFHSPEQSLSCLVRLERGAFHGLDNTGVARAPAEVAGEALADLVLCGCRNRLQKMGCGKNHARCADSALSAAVSQKGLLKEVELSVRSQAFDGDDGGAVGL